jgi:hypothetical protein
VEFQKGNITVAVSTTAVTELNLTNNSISFLIGRADVSVSNAVIGHNRILGMVENSGFDTALNVRVQLRDNDFDGAGVQEKVIGTMTPGQSAGIEFDIDYSLLTYEEGFKRLYITASTTSDEVTLGNNRRFVVIDEKIVSEPFSASVINSNTNTAAKIFTAGVLVQSNIQTDENVNLHALLYNGSGQLVSVQSRNTVLTGNTGNIINFIFELDDIPAEPFDITVLVNMPGEKSKIHVDPVMTNVKIGENRQFTATDINLNTTVAVRWEVSGNQSNGTAISTSGLLTVANDETAETLSITAICVEDNNRIGIASVNVTSYLLGDVNGDGLINIGDVDMLYQYVRGRIPSLQ